MNKEKDVYLINKWSFLLDGLNKKHHKSYAKMFENSSMNSDTNTIKLVLPMLKRILYFNPEIKLSQTSKNILSVGSIDFELVIDGKTIMPDGASAFIDYITKVVTEKFESKELQKLNHIRLTTDRKLHVSILY